MSFRSSKGCGEYCRRWDMQLSPVRRLPSLAERSHHAVIGSRKDERDAVVAQARQRNPLAFAPWTREEEQEVRRRYEAGENIQAIARAHKRSPRAIELRLQRLGVLPRE